MQTLKFFVLTLCSIIIDGQRPQQFKIVPNGRKPNTLVPQFVGGPNQTPITSRKDTSGLFTGKDSICLYGMWAAYSTKNFGEMDEASTTVWVNKSLDISKCSVLPLAGIQSLNFLGAWDLNIDQVSIYNEPNFLGGSWDIKESSGPPQGTTGFNLGSIAITGNKAWRICEDDACIYSICIDASKYGGAYYSATGFTNLNTFPIWLKVVRRVEVTSSIACLNEPNPSIFIFNGPTPA